MRLIGIAFAFLTSAAVLVAQRGPTYGSLGGFGNVLYPGTGHAPNSTVNTFPAQPRFTTPGGPFTTTGRPFGYPIQAPRYSHPGHGRSVIVPYPVFVGGGYYGGY